MQEADLAYNARRQSNGGIDGGDLHAELSAGATPACPTCLLPTSLHSQWPQCFLSLASASKCWQTAVSTVLWGMAVCFACPHNQVE